MYDDDDLDVLAGPLEIVGAGAVEIIGALVNGEMNAQQALRAARQLDPKAASLVERKYKMRRRQFLPIASVALGAAIGAEGESKFTSTDPFRAELFKLDDAIADDVEITQILVGSDSQVLGGGAIPGSLFKSTAVGVNVSFETNTPGVPISIKFRNKTAVAVTVTGTFLGTAARA